MKRTRLPFVAPGARRRYVYACCSQAEYEVVKGFADREDLSMSDFVRRCVNDWLSEESDDVPLLAEYKRDL